MVFACCAVGCHNRQGQRAGLSFYRFPTDPDKRAKWIAAVKRHDWEPTEYSRLCSDHLISGCSNKADGKGEKKSFYRIPAVIETQANQGAFCQETERGFSCFMQSGSEYFKSILLLVCAAGGIGHNYK
ncbi:peroxynitrite isomerase THAP4-like [Neoarius graeffei]|uniref:peroxynitrite isomerase THAP4-like n=1 Tax=Neoarius graeffei TaxID=443677 RepID=UPI00298CD120|nr:peroxynitrite isomerase THAP4-like [Neoarius graeffei]